MALLRTTPRRSARNLGPHGCCNIFSTLQGWTCPVLPYGDGARSRCKMNGCPVNVAVSSTNGQRTFGERYSSPRPFASQPSLLTTPFSTQTAPLPSSPLATTNSREPCGHSHTFQESIVGPLPQHEHIRGRFLHRHSSLLKHDNPLRGW